jgi:hypothetical protein
MSKYTHTKLCLQQRQPDATCICPDDQPLGPSDGEVREWERNQAEILRTIARRAAANMRERCAQEVEDVLSNYVTAERMAEKIRALNLEPTVDLTAIVKGVR